MTRLHRMRPVRRHHPDAVAHAWAARRRPLIGDDDRMPLVAAGLAARRAVLYPPDGDVAAAVDIATGLVHAR